MAENDVVSTYPAAPRFNSDVFLSFNGKDTSHSFIKNLCDSLTDHSVQFFLGDVGIGVEEEVDLSSMDAVEDSAASIVIISPSYANSWCRLEVLSRICELDRLVLPVFDQVNPSNVRRQEGPFEDDFRNHLERFGEDRVLKWRKAMKKVGDLSGLVLDSSTTSEKQHLFKRLVSRVLTELRKTVGIAAYTVGLDSRVDELMRKLNVKSNRIHVLGLHGMGGIGKTTLAKALYNKLISHFEYRCFISNIREVSEEHDGLTSLQNKVLSDLSSYNKAVDDIDSGITAIKQMLHEKRVLMILDDVSEVSQLDAFAGNIDWFGEGSQIIITTRNKEVLVEYLVNECYEVKVLDSASALQLFSYHSLRREKPIVGFEYLSKQIVSLTGGLPLALEVFGSYLFHKRTIEEWEDALKKLQQIRPCNLQDVLRISFDALDEEEKCVFLDIACFFIKIRMKREEAVDILKGCGFKAEAAITVLTAKSLIKINEDYLWMHDQLRDMGRQIVRLENLVDPGSRSRLWDRDEIMTVLKHKKGTEYVQGIILDFRKKRAVEDLRADAIFFNNFITTPNLNSALAYVKEICTMFLSCLLHGADKDKELKLRTEFFEPMVKMRLLQINCAKLEGKFKNFPAELKWLQWKRCPLKYLPSDYCPRKLAILDLSESGIERVWGCRSNMVAEHLMVMNLQGCSKLLTIPDLSGYKSLEKLNLEYCVQLTEIDESVGKLTTLLHLNLRGCSGIVKFPSYVSGLKHLQTLVLSDCGKLKQLPDDIGSMKSLRQLLADGTAISKLPDSFHYLTNLEKLSLIGCQLIKQLPKCFGNLKSLKDLSLNQSSLEELPDSIGSLLNLETLSCMWCKSLTRIPESIGNLQLLTKLLLDNSGIKELPTSIGSLYCLKVLSVGGCSSLTNLPDSMEGLDTISELHLDGTSISGLPRQIGALKTIEKLSLAKCMSLRYLPEATGSMLSLTVLNLFGSNIAELPESFGMLENIVRLRLNECKELQRLPTSIGNLKSLCSLLMEKTSVTELPESFGMLSRLTILRMRKKPLKYFCHQEKLVFLPPSFSNLSSLEELDAHAWRISGKIPDSFEKLSMLEILKLGYNNFHCLPSSLKGLSILKKLHMPWCEELLSLPPLPPSLEEVDVSNCISLENIFDLSNLERLESLNITNCAKLRDIPGLECLKSLKRLYMSGCTACSSAVKRRLSKVCLRNMYTISIPGSKIPDWFNQQVVSFSEFNNREIVAVIVCAVISLNHEIPDELRDELPALPAIQARILKLNKPVMNYTFPLLGVPKTNDDQLHFCRFPRSHRLLSGWKSGYKLEVGEQNPPIIRGVELKKCGVFPVYENDDERDGDENWLHESQKSVSEKLAMFFNSMEEDE